MKILLALTLLIFTSASYAQCKNYTVYKNGQYENVRVCDHANPINPNDGYDSLIENLANPPGSKTCKNVLINGVYQYICY